jgi:hypothetical protein
MMLALAIDAGAGDAGAAAGFDACDGVDACDSAFADAERGFCIAIDGLNQKPLCA